MEPRPVVPRINGRAMGITNHAITKSPSETIAPARVPGTDKLPKPPAEPGTALSVRRGMRVTFQLVGSSRVAYVTIDAPRTEESLLEMPANNPPTKI